VLDRCFEVGLDLGAKGRIGCNAMDDVYESHDWDAPFQAGEGSTRRRIRSAAPLKPLDALAMRLLPAE
jgi:hypothetical protein